MSTKSYENFSKIIQERGISTYRVAKETGIAQSTFSDWKKGKSTPKYDKLKKIADYLNIDIKIILDKPLIDMTPIVKKVSRAINKPCDKWVDKIVDICEKSKINDPIMDQIFEKLSSLSPEFLKIALNQIDLLVKLQKEKEK